ncbi:unnamed protein product [Phytomonas sp. Hart1]|nr:unnamed protein product [Phytomonas sp. Hart1]|eukprot:CCW66525.1 unnamed protein product [Phytomonas sp. isolate Hart1]
MVYSVGFQPRKKFENYSLESPFIDKCVHPKRSQAVPSFPLPVVTHMFKKFKGAHWRRLIDNSIELLRRTFTREASWALNILPEQIRGVEFRLGSLYVTFHVTHDDDVSQEEMRQRIEEYPFNEMWQLYNQSDSATDDLDALGNVIKGLEEQLTQKDIELESTRKINERHGNELAEEISKLRNSVEAAENREKDLLKELEKAIKHRKTSEAHLTASKEENQRLLDDLENTKNNFAELEGKYKELITAIVQENKKETEARERELKEQITVKSYIIQDLEAKLGHSRGVEVDPHSFLNRNNSDASRRLALRIEEMLLQLRLIEKSKIDVHSELGRISESLRFTEKARFVQSVFYET